MTATPLVVEAVRGDVVESTHIVDAVVCDADGTLLASAGDAGTVAYLRSVSKPVQATVCMELGWEPPGDPQLAVACASHNGEPSHIDAVRGTLEAAGLDEDALRCPGDGRGRILHNCSGKHAAMLATCVAKGWDPAGYLDAGTELQRAVRARIESIARRPARAVATDGCGVPTFAFTLAEAASMFARLPGETPRALDAMGGHPFLVAGSHRICTAAMSAVPGLVVKVGAEGLICAVLPGSPRGMALKARDGGARGREVATVHALSVLDVWGAETADGVLAEVRPRILPGGGRHPDLRCRGSFKQP